MQPRHVLYVEDDPTLRGILTDMLQAAPERLLITGEVSGLQPGTRLTPWSIRPGRATTMGRPIVIDADGTFTCSRRAAKKATWRIHISDGNGVRSNIVIFR